MLRNCAVECIIPATEKSVFEKEMAFVDKYEGKCVSITVNGETTKGAVVEVRSNGKTLIMDFAGGYFVQCPVDGFDAQIISREDVESYIDGLENEKGNTIRCEQLKARIDRLLS